MAELRPGDRVRSTGGHVGTLETPEPGDARVCVRFDHDPDVIAFVEPVAIHAEPAVIGVEFDFPIADWDRANSRHAVAALADFCTELSEADCCACWLTQQGFYLWAGIVIEATTDEMLELQRLHDEAGGWLHWFNKESPDRFQGGLTFIPTAEWLPMFEAWAEKQTPKAEAVLHG